MQTSHLKRAILLPSPIGFLCGIVTCVVWITSIFCGGGSRADASLTSSKVSEVKNVKLHKLPASIEKLSVLCLNGGERVLLHLGSRYDASGAELGGKLRLEEAPMCTCRSVNSGFDKETWKI